jgi:PilZ domain-containing protein
MSEDVLLVENRTTTRRRVFKAGTIAFGRGGSIPSIIWNLSPTGAMLEVDNVIDIPDKFTLVIEADRFNRSCRVIWRKAKKIGVRFGSWARRERFAVIDGGRTV